MIQVTMPMPLLLKHWQQLRLLTPLDRHFANQMDQIHQSHSDLLLLFCALLSRQLSAQHPCLKLDELDFSNPLGERQVQCVINASLPECLQALAQIAPIGQPGDDKPLILDGSKLYLKRYYDFECQVATTLTRLSQHGYPHTQASISALNTLFPAQDSLDWQKVATATAFCQQLAIITGGPGTGKTTTVTKLLLLLCLQNELNIKLVAPTGKAAARLSESIKASKRRLSAELQDAARHDALIALAKIPEEASTLHRLLGVLPHSHQFRHHSDNPLHLDLLVVDEASMVDLPMMQRLLSAMPAHARLILLGDQDQLASVEAGAVLADICAGLHDADGWRMRYSPEFAASLTEMTGHIMSQFVCDEPGLGDNLCMLRHSHRFVGDAGIGILAKAVNECSRMAIRQAWQKGYQELQWFDDGPHQSGLEQLKQLACEQYRDYLAIIYRADFSAEIIIERYNQFRILCATRAGEYGVDGINLHVTQALKQAGLIRPEQEFYAGRPIIIQSNDYNLGLFNGDIGLILPDNSQEQPRLMAHFIQADGTILTVLPARLPSHQTCFAMTVHKSQGSEFAHVALVLPPSPSPAQQQLLTKELIYTAITRAKAAFTCLGVSRVFEQASLQRTARASGLAERIWPNFSADKH
ncbi:exodeoxyribonuclease V subunit alpha [Shewanella sp. NIFS-20-20]|uniref:exodeoxyribonuclease V subunit alpha n=1 Tax=Shewanella sp. NIFS-20-20 TaxID=2853806 RepID=UPI001C46EC40|nr:exodeoxyribonuclease V subunit alpha [Shewanella sp. NIFS-20-20]MBV7315080.1 exodeoxyribonuclease V subunit alpha [Shewanella sp. NIFS-20-20]